MELDPPRNPTQSGLGVEDLVSLPLVPIHNSRFASKLLLANVNHHYFKGLASIDNEGHSIQFQEEPKELLEKGDFTWCGQRPDSPWLQNQIGERPG